jgi:hypothetical protein
LEQFENGTPMQSISSSKSTPQGSDRRIGEIGLPRDHFDLLLKKLALGSIYQIGQSMLTPRSLDQAVLSSDQDPLVADDDEELFQGIYRVAYL